MQQTRQLAKPRQRGRSIQLPVTQWDSIHQIATQLRVSTSVVLRWAVEYALDHYPSWPTPR